MILLKKTIRAMLSNKSSYIACILLIAIGVMFYMAMGVAVNSLDISKDVYFKTNNMADVFVKVNQAPYSIYDELMDIDGIKDSNLRIVQEVRYDKQETEKIITLRLISIDSENENEINKIIINDGILSNSNDIIVTTEFLTIHSLNIGDLINVVVNGKLVPLRIAGVGISPEYIYMTRDAKEMVPDPETFSIAFMEIENISNLFNFNGSFNDIVLTLEDGYTFNDVEIKLNDVLNKCGIIELIEQKDQLSTMMYEQEIKSISSMATTIPFVFFCMASIVLYLVLKRIVEQDRMQIGTLKAFGFSNFSIIFHYLLYGIIIGTIGGIIGTIMGYLLSYPMMKLYAEYFKLPLIAGKGSLYYIITSVLMAFIINILGAYLGVRKAVKLNPAEAMRPVAPKITKRNMLKYFPFVDYIFTSSGKMSLRSIARGKTRSLFIVIGIMFSFSIMAFMSSYSTMVDVMILDMFEKVQVYDAKISLDKFTPELTAIEDIRHIDGVYLSEGLLEVPGTIKKDGYTEGLILMGVKENSDMFKVYDSTLRTNIPLSRDGVILNSKIAKDYGLETGDKFLFSTPYYDKDVLLNVAGLVDQSLGGYGFIEINALRKSFNLPDIVSAVAVFTNEPQILKNDLRDGDNIAAVEDKLTIIENYYGFLGTYEGLISSMQIISSFVAFIIIYNTAVISLSERKREYATLSILGMHTKEISSIMSLEYGILCVIGMYLGIHFTQYLKAQMAALMTNTAFSFPTYTPPSALLSAAIGCTVAVILSNLYTRRKIKKMDIVETLKERE